MRIVLVWWLVDVATSESSDVFADAQAMCAQRSLSKSSFPLGAWQKRAINQSPANLLHDAPHPRVR